MVKKSLVVAVMMAGSYASTMAQDAQKGAAVFNICLACHAIGPGAQNKIGPELNGLEVPGTKMIFPGIKNEQQAKDLWAYVSQFDANGDTKK
jgi:cytochrome c